MAVLLKYDGFLPKNDGDTVASSLYRVNLSETQSVDKANPSVVLLVDVSGSMYDNMMQLREAVSSTVDLVLSKNVTTLDKIVLITFESYANVYSNFESYDKLKETVSRFLSGGGTNYGNALKEVVTLLKVRKRIITVMFSDGAPTSPYQDEVEELKTVARQESLLFHAIGLNVCHGWGLSSHDSAETILRNLTTIGSREGYYQSIDDSEIEQSMNVLVNHFDSYVEAYIDGKHRTRLGFFVGAADALHFDVEYNDLKVRLDNLDNKSFEGLLDEDENSITIIFDAISYLLEYYIKDESFAFDQAISIVEYVSSLTRETENKLKSIQRASIEKIANERRTELDSICDTAGANTLKQKSLILGEYTKRIQSLMKDHSAQIRRIHEIKELCAQILENLRKNQNIAATVSGEVMNTVSQFRDNSIALKRKNIARLSSKVRDENKKFEDIDQLLQSEIDSLVTRDSIPVPKYFEDYTDPLTLNNFEEIMLHKYGVFMLLITVERHLYGLTAPHKTKIVEVGGFSASVLDVMTNNENKALIFDFRGIGSGNAAIPLWIDELHWTKARHVFGPFVGHAVTGNELEYTKLQGSTILAIVLLHLRRQQPSEYNRELIRMVGETLKVNITKKKWVDVLNNVTNSFETLNENIIPSIGIFLVFVEFIGVKLQDEKALLLLAEEYRRRNKKRIESEFQNLESLSPSTRKKCKLLIRMFPNIFQQYLFVSPEKIVASMNKKSIENYFLNLYDGKENELLESFNKFAEKTAGVLRKRCSELDDKQKLAIVLSVHKCICFTWDALKDNQIPAGFSYDSNYPDLLLGWCKKTIQQKHEKELKGSEEMLLLKLLQSDDETEAETIVKNIKRNSHVWGALMHVLLRTCKIDGGTGLKRDEWRKLSAEKFKEQIETMSIPFHYKLIMYCVYDSFKPEDWISSKMVWRPNKARRRRLKMMFPESTEIE